MNIFSSNQPKAKPPAWMRYAIAAFLAVAAFKAYRAQEEGIDNELNLKNYPLIHDFVSVDRWQTILDPDFGKEIDYFDQTLGKGDIAVCGQAVTIRVSADDAPDVVLPDDFTVPTEPIRFTIGDSQMHPLWDRSVRGMSEGGVRQIQAGPRLFFPEQKTPEGEPAPFLLELLKVEPYEDNPNAFEQETVDAGKGKPFGCGDTIRVQFNVLDAEGNIEQTLEKQTLTIGQSQFGHGIDRGAIGMRPGTIRRLKIPPSYHPVAPTELRFPEGKIAIVEIAAIAYKDDEIEEPLIKEPEHGTDRESS